MRPRALAATLAALALALAGCAGSAPQGSGDGTAATPAPSSAPPAGAGAGASSSPAAASCPGTHAHATFAVFVAGAAGPQRVDYAAPRASTGGAWYDLGASPTMTVAVHLHQHGSEQGGSDLGPAQFHYESRGRCPTVAQSMAAVETRVEADGVTLHGGHARAQQEATWPGPVRAWLQSAQQGEGGCAWLWREAPDLQAWLGHAPRDGEALLVAAGTFTPEQVAGMQQQVPAPMTRGEPACP